MTPVLDSPVSRRSLLRVSAIAGAAVAAPWNGALAALAAQTPVAAADDLDALFAEVDARVLAGMAELNVPGVAIGVIAGEREHAAGFGITSIEHPLPVDAETLFQLGSTSKTITGTALMRLVEQGKLDLEAPVRSYLPDFRVADETASAEVRVRHLVTHTAGWFGDDFADTGDGDDALARFIAEMDDLPQIAPPGEHFSYNNAAVVVAGRLIEVATNQPYETAVRELVLAPLGMAQTFFFPEEIMTEAFAVGHTPPLDDPEGPLSVAQPWALPRAANPAGGAISSVSDQLRYAHFHLGDGASDGERLLTAESMRRMQEPLGPGGSLGPFVLDGVGVSWLLTTIGGEQIVFHGGSTNGQQSVLLLAPSRAFAITILTNAEAGAVLGQELAVWALDRFLGLRLPPVTPITADPGQLTEYSGVYDSGGGIVFTVSAEGDALTLAATVAGEPYPGGSGPLPLVGEDRAAFDLAGQTFLTDFVRDDAGQVAWIRVTGRLAPRQA